MVLLHNPLRKLGYCAMAGLYNEAERRLCETARSQQGFFTTKQAIRGGLAEKTHAYPGKAGNGIRVHRGIYRLADFPPAERPDLMLWYLWSQNRREIPEGTYSHETALSLHELSDIIPSKLHMTVPKKFRRNSQIPEILVLQRADLNEGDVQDAHGVKVTRPLRTILDLLETRRAAKRRIGHAIAEALGRGLTSSRQIDALPSDT